MKRTIKIWRAQCERTARYVSRMRISAEFIAHLHSQRKALVHTGEHQVVGVATSKFAPIEKISFRFLRNAHDIFAMSFGPHWYGRHDCDAPKHTENVLLLWSPHLRTIFAPRRVCNDPHLNILYPFVAAFQPNVGVVAYVCVWMRVGLKTEWKRRTIEMPKKINSQQNSCPGSLNFEWQVAFFSALTSYNFKAEGVNESGEFSTRKIQRPRRNAHVPPEFKLRQTAIPIQFKFEFDFVRRALSAYSHYLAVAHIKIASSCRRKRTITNAEHDLFRRTNHRLVRALFFFSFASFETIRMHNSNGR